MPGQMGPKPNQQQQQRKSSLSPPPGLKSLLAGYAGGASAVLVGHPMDSIKVALQTRGKMAGGATPTPSAAAPAAAAGTPSPKPTQSPKPTPSPSPAMGSVKHLSTTAAADSRLPAPRMPRSLQSLYAGVSPQLMTMGLINSAVFAMYDGVRQHLHQQQSPVPNDDSWRERDPLWHVSASALAASLMVAIPTNPLNVIRTQQQVHLWDFRTALMRTYSRGLSSFFVGLAPHFMCEGAGRTISFTTYEFLKRRVVGWKQQLNQETTIDTRIRLSERVLCAAAGGVVCWSFIFPFDVVRCRLYAEPPSSTSSSMTAWELARLIYQTEGWRTFYRGLGVTVARAAVTSAVMLPVYDVTLEWLNSETR